MRDLSGMTIVELDAYLSKLKADLEEVEEERMFVLGQTGLHVSASVVTKYDRGSGATRPGQEEGANVGNRRLRRTAQLLVLMVLGKKAREGDIGSEPVLGLRFTVKNVVGAVAAGDAVTGFFRGRRRCGRTVIPAGVQEGAVPTEVAVVEPADKPAILPRFPDRGHERETELGACTVPVRRRSSCGWSTSLCQGLWRAE
jgi:hypothetical protein